jgi:dolichol kinase
MDPLVRPTQVVVQGETSLDAGWVGEVRAILADADASAWRAERAEELRRRVTAVVASVRERARERAASSGVNARTEALVTTMESALPTEPTRARWAAFVGVVHPEYEALLNTLPTQSAAGAPSVRPTNYARSLFHAGSAAVGLASVALIPSHTIILGIALTFATYAWSMEIGRRFSPKMNDWLMRMYGPVSHPHERYKINSATWYATALVFLALFASRPATMAALAVLGVADPVAALVGRRWGKHRIRTGRSIEGTVGFIVSGAIVAAGALAWAGGLSVAAIAAYALLAAAVGAVAELVTTQLDDNLTIPVVVGGTLTAIAALVG